MMENFGEFISKEELRKSISYESMGAFYIAISRLRRAVAGRFYLLNNLKGGYALMEIARAPERS